jgi:hypothetical protein
MTVVIAALLIIAAAVFTLTIRERDLPEPEPVSPFRHLDERKAAIYENLRDLQFEYRLGKLSDEDYQQTKVDLQKELAAVLAEVDRIKQELGMARPSPKAQAGKGRPAPNAASSAAPAAPAAKPAPAAVVAVAEQTTEMSEEKTHVCPHCGAQFGQSLRFCGECGKPMAEKA